MNQLVSAIITTHNRADLLPRAIESVLSQTYQNIECIVVSDNSNDGTVEYCSQRNDITFINIPNEESKGGNHARNVGILVSKGEYIAFLDDDDYWLPEKIEKQLHMIESSKCDFVYCGRSNEIVDKEGLVSLSETDYKSLESGDFSKKVLLTCCVTTSSAMIISRHLLFDVGLFDEELCFWQDYELTIRLAQLTEFAVVHENLFIYRINPNDTNRLTNKYYEWWDAVNYIHKKHKKLYKSLSLNERRVVKLMTYKDAYMRASNCGLNKEKKRLIRSIKVWGLPEIIKDKIHRKNYDV